MKNKTNNTKHVMELPEGSEWSCQLFGGGEGGIVWTPEKGKNPNWFWRLMQYVFFGNRWIKKKRNK
jgi:hypothetical protein